MSGVVVEEVKSEIIVLNKDLLQCCLSLQDGAEKCTKRRSEIGNHCYEQRLAAVLPFVAGRSGKMHQGKPRLCRLPKSHVHSY
jgi:hypothetical protein